MSVLLVVLSLAAAFILMVFKALAVDQVKGQIQRRITAHLEATIADLPDALQDEWAEEWRADLAMQISMPVTALRFVRGVRRSAHELVGEPALAPASLSARASQQLRRARGPIDAFCRASQQLRRARGPIDAFCRHVYGNPFPWLLFASVAGGLAIAAFYNLVATAATPAVGWFGVSWWWLGQTLLLTLLALGLLAAARRTPRDAR